MNLSFFETRRALSVWGAVLALALLAIGGVLYYNHRSSGMFVKKLGMAISQSEMPKFASALTGLPVSDESLVYPQVVGVMIDNHADARPQSGIDRADVVYEAPVEGGITRYFALFASSTFASEVGPVRSARPYFLDWLAEYGDGLYMHSGGSPEALQLIKTRGLFDANEFYFGSYYWRDTRRAAPHNLYTDQKSWVRMLDQRAHQREKVAEWEGWKFDMPSVPVLLATSTIPTSVAVRFTQGYVVGWQASSTGQFTKYLNDKPLLTRDGQKIVADTVVFASMPVTTIDDEGRRAIQTLGSGEVVVWKKGMLVHGTWKKTSLTDRTRWYDMHDQEIALTPGKIWVEIVPEEIPLTITSGS